MEEENEEPDGIERRARGNQGLFRQLFTHDARQAAADFYEVARPREFVQAQEQFPQLSRAEKRGKPRRFVAEIPKFTREDRDDITEWLDTWNRATVANFLIGADETVILPLYLSGRGSRFFRH